MNLRAAHYLATVREKNNRRPAAAAVRIAAAVLESADRAAVGTLGLHDRMVRTGLAKAGSDQERGSILHDSPFSFPVNLLCMR